MFAKFSKFFLLLLILSSMVIAQNSEKKEWSEENWGLGLGFRGATIPFSTEDKNVMSVVPMVFFENDIFYLKGFEYGIKLYKSGNWQYFAMSRRHFFDAPKDVQNVIQGDNVDFGLHVRYSLPNSFYIAGEIMTDVVVSNDVWRTNPTMNLRVAYQTGKKGMYFEPYFEAKFKSSKYNSWYYGLNQVDVDAGVEMALGFVANYRVISNFYLFGAGKFAMLDGSVRGVTIPVNGNEVSVNSDMHAEVYFGFGFSNDESKPRKTKLSNTPYWRVGQGFATPSTLGDIMKFNSVPDTNNNKLTSVFYGHPLTDEFFGLPIDIYISPGFTWHWQSDVQPNSFELNLAIKLYYTVKWPIRWRLGAAEGVSWVNKIPYMEAHSLAEKDYNPSNLMNFLDFSVDLNIGDIFGGEDLKKWWLGYYIHHRSSIFETAQHFGRISGGSNYHTFYLLWNY